jgi:hypothetical protein
MLTLREKILATKRPGQEQVDEAAAWVLFANICILLGGNCCQRSSKQNLRKRAKLLPIFDYFPERSLHVAKRLGRFCLQCMSGSACDK